MKLTTGEVNTLKGLGVKFAIALPTVTAVVIAATEVAAHAFRGFR